MSSIAPTRRISKPTSTRTATACLGCGHNIILEENSAVTRASNGEILGYIHKPPVNASPRAIHHCMRMAFIKSEAAAIVVENRLYDQTNFPMPRTEPRVRAQDYTGPGSATKFAGRQHGVTTHTISRGATSNHIPT